MKKQEDLFIEIIVLLILISGVILFIFSDNTNKELITFPKYEIIK